MSSFEGLPPIIRQMIDEARNKKNPEHIRFNYIQSLERIKDACEFVIREFRNKK